MSYVMGKEKFPGPKKSYKPPLRMDEVKNSKEQRVRSDDGQNECLHSSHSPKIKGERKKKEELSASNRSREMILQRLLIIGANIWRHHKSDRISRTLISCLLLAVEREWHIFITRDVL